MIVLDLFSGIGGFSLGLHWAGFRTAAFCEADPFCRAVLARHWPGVPCYDDVCTLSAARLRADGVPLPDLLCGGFPCQDVSVAGPGSGPGGGLDGVRSGLWREMLRLVDECRPPWVVVENVPALRVRGADRLLGGLEALGYAGWPLLVGAAHAGAPHRRQRVFVVAHAAGARLEERERSAGHATPRLPAERRRAGWDGPAAPAGVRGVADGVPAGLDGTRLDGTGLDGAGQDRTGLDGARLDRTGRHRTARLKALGNAVSPAVAAMVGRAVRQAASA